jgi:hypothetical protein
MNRLLSYTNYFRYLQHRVNAKVARRCSPRTASSPVLLQSCHSLADYRRRLDEGSPYAATSTVRPHLSRYNLTRTRDCSPRLVAGVQVAGQVVYLLSVAGKKVLSEGALVDFFVLFRELEMCLAMCSAASEPGVLMITRQLLERYQEFTFAKVEYLRLLEQLFTHLEED